MNIAVDSVAVYASKDRGMGKYTICQLEKMAELNPNNNYYYFNYYGKKHVGTFINSADNIHEVMIECGRDGVIASSSLYSNIFGRILSGYLKKYDIDVFYITSMFDKSIQLYKKRWFDNVYVCATFYDLIPYLYSDHYLPDEKTLNDYMERLENYTWVDRIFAISQSAKVDLCNKVNIDENKVTVIYGAPNDKVKRIEIDDDRKKGILNKFGIKNSFIICVAGDDERKNISGLIQAYANINERLKNNYQLVVVCKLSEQSYNRYSEEIKNLNVNDRVILTNFVSDEELLLLYNSAYVCAFVSKYEGLGLPVLEAYACDLPVITSNNSSLVEVAGNAAIQVDPYDSKQITEGINAILSFDNDERIRRISLGHEILNHFKWEKTAELTLNSLCLNEEKEDRIKRRIAFFTPLPPVESGTADYSVDILNSISDNLDVIDVFTDGTYIYNCDLKSNINVYSHTAFCRDKYDEIIYQFGNSMYHAYMIEYIKKYPGIIVLHDANLNGMLSYMDVWSGANWKKYKRHLMEDFSEEVSDKIIIDVTNGKNVAEPVNGFIVNYANKIITHSKWAQKQVLNRNINRNVYVIPLYSKIDNNFNSEGLREKYNYNSEDIVIGAFGILGKTKRSIQEIKACVRLWNEGYKFKLLLAGKIIEPDLEKDINAILAENEVAKANIRITGYTELDDFLNYMHIVDIALNLRYPYNGETSGALARLLAMGKCVMVNDIGSFSEVPEEACFRIKNVEDMEENEEVDLIYDKLKTLLDNKKIRENISQNARYYAAKELSLDNVKEKYINVINSKTLEKISEEDLEIFAHNEFIKYSENEKRAVSKAIAECFNM